MQGRVMMILFANPWIAFGMGKGLLALASLMTALGFGVARFGRRVARVFSGTGVEPPDVISAWPVWLQVLTPSTAVHWAVVAVLFAFGAYSVWIGRWLKRAGA